MALVGGASLLVLLIALLAVLAGFTGGSSPKPVATASALPSSTTVSTASVGLDPVEQARSFRANEMGRVMVLMYHLIGRTDSRYNRTPEQFRRDIADLKAAGFYPINVRDLAGGRIDIPAGKSPVAITFDDSSGGQYRINPDGRLDPDCAVAIMEEAVRQGAWTSRAAFFPLLEVDAPDRIVFGQPEFKKQKLQQLVSWGYEVGSHTVSHLNLKKASSKEAQRQLYTSKSMLEEMIGGDYEVVSLAAPFGEYPAQTSILESGEHDGRPYRYQAALKAAGNASLSPYSEGFDAYRIQRIEVTGSSFSEALAFFEESPQLRYVSDGDPATVAVPHALDPSLGSVRTGLNQKLIRY